MIRWIGASPAAELRVIEWGLEERGRPLFLLKRGRRAEVLV